MCHGYEHNLSFNFFLVALWLFNLNVFFFFFNKMQVKHVELMMLCMKRKY